MSKENKDNAYHDLDIIDMDEEFANSDYTEAPSLNTDSRTDSEHTSDAGSDAISDSSHDTDSDVEKESGKTRSKRFPFKINFHIAFILIVILIILLVISRFSNWGIKIDLEEYFKTHEYVEVPDTLDQFLPLTDSDGNIIPTKENPTILFMGNAPFADDRDSADGLVNMIGKMANAKTINCSVSGSYLSAINKMPDLNYWDYPMDSFNFYWMCHMLVKSRLDFNYEAAKGYFGTALPPEADEVYSTVTTLDLNTVDVLAIMYDGSDYYAGHGMWNDENDTDILTFNGNLTAGIELIKSQYPHIRIIVMSPTYAFAINEDGEYVSSDIYTYGQDVLSSYVIRESYSTMCQGVTFIDHLYGTINEDNAKDYLTDNIHLNIAGRKKVAERFLSALNYYKD